METKHTPTPYRPHDMEDLTLVSSETHQAIALFRTAEDMQFTRRACNAHDELVAALQNIMNGITSGSITSEYDETMEKAVIQAHDALVKARGEV